VKGLLKHSALKGYNASKN